MKTGLIGAMLGLFIGIVFVMAIIPAIADQTGAMLTKSIITNESLDISSAWDEGGAGLNSSITFTVTDEPSGWKITGCPLTDVAWGNATQVFTLTTDYSVSDSTGVMTIVPTAIMNGSGNDTVVSYTGCRDGYLTDSGSKGVTSLILIFSGLAIVGFAVFHLGRNFDLF